MKKINLLFCLIVLCNCTVANRHNIGAEYLGTKYVLNPLGEGKTPDTDPLFRTDAFDCATFVETVLADGDLNKLNKIRYKDEKIDFLNRNHFIETDWLKNNNNIVQNISSEYGKTALRKATIDKKSWAKKMYDINTDFKPETIYLEYIPYSDATNIKTDKPLIVLFIVDNPSFHDKIGTDLAVIHMGFLLPNNILRHASRIKGRVVDEDFDKYINARKKKKTNVGIALLEIK